MNVIPGLRFLISLMASIPFIPGILISIRAISGLNLSASSITLRPVLAVSITTSLPNSSFNIYVKESITIPSSSAIIIRYIILYKEG